MRVDPRNVDQAAAWDGDEGDFWAANAERLDHLVAGYDADLFAAARLAADRILDIGCGTGFVTREAAGRAPRGFALGVDLSARMLDTARRLAEAVERLTLNATFEQCDAQLHPFGDDVFDAVISRNRNHVLRRPRPGVREHPGGALRPGRAADDALRQPGAQLNPWVTAVASALAPGLASTPGVAGGAGPFSLSDPVVIRDLLGAAGFARIHCEGLHRPMTYGGDVDSAEEFVLGLAGWILEGRSPEERREARGRLRALLVRRVGPDGVTLGSATWLTTAVRPGRETRD